MRIMFLSAALLLAFGAGFGVARFTAKTSAAGTPNSAWLPDTSSAKPLGPVSANSDVKAPTLSSTPDSAPSAPPTYAALRAAALLASKQFRGMRIDPFTFEQLDPNFAKLYELTPSEVAHLEAVFRRAKEQVDALEAEKAQIEPQADGTIRVTIEPSPEEGGMFHDVVRSELLATLGRERSALFQQLSDSDGSDSTEFGGFGLRRTVIEIGAVGPDGKFQATWSASIDPKTKLQTVSMQTDLPALKNLKPALHARIVGAAAAP